jgi:apolipoprotein N-acyltransferase
MQTDVSDEEAAIEAVEAPKERRSWSHWWEAALAPLSVLFLTLAAPPVGASWLGWIATAPLFWALVRATEGPRPVRRAAALGFLHGFCYLLALAPWFAAFSPAGYPVAAAYWGLLSAGTAALTAAAVRKSPAVLAPPLLAAGWTVLEWLRAQGTLTFPWGTLSATQYRDIAILQMLDLTGAFGLSFLMALCSASLACWLLAVGRETTPYRLSLAGTAPVWGMASLVLVGVGLARGGWVLANAGRPKNTVKVAVVQSSESRQEGPAVVCVSPLEDYEARTKEALKAGAQLVVWPESACQGDAVHDPMVRQRLIDLLWGSKAHLLTGSFIYHPESGQTMNGAMMQSPNGRILGQYAKVLIVPFGEYLPLRPLLRWTERLGMPAEDLRAGMSWTPLDWERGKVGVSICFESAFGNVSRTHVKRGANMLAILTSDGWAGRTTAGLQHAAFAPLRAVETRRSVARAAATGVSQLIDPYGRPLKSLPMFTKGIAVGELPLRTSLTPYVRFGDWPVGLAWGLLLLGLCIRQRSSH